MSPIDRKEMHRRLDELLDRRAKLEAGEVNFVSVKALPDNCHAAYGDTLSFAADVCGVHLIANSVNPIWKVENEQQAILYALRDRLTMASSLLAAKGVTYGAVKVCIDRAEVIEFQLDIDFIRTELLVLAKGDATVLFDRRPGRKGQPKNQFQLAKMKLRALEWERFFLSRSPPINADSDESSQIRQNKVALMSLSLEFCTKFAGLYTLVPMRDPYDREKPQVNSK